MQDIDKYVDSLCKNIDYKLKESNEFKSEIKEHLLETINELKREGKSEEESFKIAIYRFGEEDELINQISEVIHVKNPIIKILNLISVISIIFFGILLIKSYPDMDTLKGPILIILIPIYIVIKIRKISKIKDIQIDKRYEILKFILIIYGIIIVGINIFPIDISNINLNDSINIYFRIMPLSTIRHQINSIGIYPVVAQTIKAMMIYVPLGILLPLIFNKYNRLRNYVAICIYINIIMILIRIILNLFGMNSIVVVSSDYIIMNILGIISGYIIYNNINFKKVV